MKILGLVSQFYLYSLDKIHRTDRKILYRQGTIY